MHMGMGDCISLIIYDSIELISDHRNGHYFEYQMVQHMYTMQHTMNVRNLHLIGWLLKMSLINWGLSEIDEGKDNK